MEVNIIIFGIFTILVFVAGYFLRPYNKLIGDKMKKKPDKIEIPEPPMPDTPMLSTSGKDDKVEDIKEVKPSGDGFEMTKEDMAEYHDILMGSDPVQLFIKVSEGQRLYEKAQEIRKLLE